MTLAFSRFNERLLRSSGILSRIRGTSYFIENLSGMPLMKTSPGSEIRDPDQHHHHHPASRVCRCYVSSPIHHTACAPQHSFHHQLHHHQVFIFTIIITFSSWSFKHKYISTAIQETRQHGGFKSFLGSHPEFEAPILWENLCHLVKMVKRK